ncbi:MAG: cob(I)yrinic acid a,c-diamide adenosyltransferase [Candidatus Liptonbacteria bacterium]|nr:cob(I)yrinic acid a,c-diamide adenosyltransferase [Candidatus Liptonbacteria bacterium]
MIIVFTGNGKGKTTASLGQMVRVLGRGKSALMIQFIKGPWRSGEDEFSERFALRAQTYADPNADQRGQKIPTPQFTVKKMGLGFVGILGDKLPREEHQKAAEKALEYFKEEAAGKKWYLIVLDEINVAVSLGLLKPEHVIDAIKDYPKERLLILSGRGAPEEFIDAADLATEMKEIKHPFNDGELAKYGVEF